MLQVSKKNHEAGISLTAVSWLLVGTLLPFQPSHDAEMARLWSADQLPWPWLVCCCFCTSRASGQRARACASLPSAGALHCQLLSLWDRDNWDALFSTSGWTHRSHLVKPCTIPLQLNNGLSYQLTTGKSSCNFNGTMKINHAYKT